jgi:hypothetical protein
MVVLLGVSGGLRMTEDFELLVVAESDGGVLVLVGKIVW